MEQWGPWSDEPAFDPSKTPRILQRNYETFDMMDLYKRRNNRKTKSENLIRKQRLSGFKLVPDASSKKPKLLTQPHSLTTRIYSAINSLRHVEKGSKNLWNSRRGMKKIHPLQQMKHQNDPGQKEKVEQKTLTMKNRYQPMRVFKQKERTQLLEGQTFSALKVNQINFQIPKEWSELYTEKRLKQIKEQEKARRFKIVLAVEKGNYPYRKWTAESFTNDTNQSETKQSLRAEQVEQTNHI